MRGMPSGGAPESCRWVLVETTSFKHAYEREGDLMAAARTAVRGLTDDEVQTIRAGLAGGRRPRVVLTESAGQIAGQIGQVVALLDPAESDEWVVVRFGRDELPFSPGDLRVAPKGAAARKAVVPSPPREPAQRRPEPEFLIDKPVPAKSA